MVGAWHNPSVLAVVHHLERPFLGRAALGLRAPDIELEEVHLRRGDALPALAVVDGIVSLGGEQSARDADTDPLLAAEATWLGAAVEAGVPVLGVCLGAQLLAYALGARVYRLPRRMMSWEPLEPTSDGSADPVIGVLPPGARGLQWNEDGFDLPRGAVELVRRTAPSCQAFRFGDSAWGVQFHPDIDEPSLEHWYARWSHATQEAGVSVAAARAADAAHLPLHLDAGEAVFRAFVDVIRD